MVWACPTQAGNDAGKEKFDYEVWWPKMRKGYAKDDVEVVKIDMKKCNLSEDQAQDRLEWRNRIRVANPNIVGKRL